MAFTVNFPVDTGTFVITNYKDVDLSKPETLLGRVGTIACYQSITQESDDNSFIVMVSGYKDAWCQETLLDWLHIATNEEVELYKKEMGVKWRRKF